MRDSVRKAKSVPSMILSIPPTKAVSPSTPMVVRSQPASRWVGSGLRHLGQGSWIAVPPPYRSAGPREWLIPPDGTGALLSGVSRELALRQANGTLAVLTPPAAE